MKTKIGTFKSQISHPKFLGALPLLLCLFAHAQARDTYPRQPGLDAQQYRIRLRIADTGEDIRAETEIVFAVRAENVREVVGGGEIVQVCVAGVASVLPAGSVARTDNVCVVASRPL